jgi:formate/nitrite transporter
MDYVKPAAVAQSMFDAGTTKLAIAPRDLFIRGMLSGAILGVATSLAFTGAVTTGQPIVGAIIFPVGLVSIVLLGLELVTGSFALLPLPWIEGRASFREVFVNLCWVIFGNLVGSVIYGFLLAIALTNMFAIAPAGVAQRIVQTAEAKTIGYAAFGMAGWITAFVKAILCNWMVCLGMILGNSSTSMTGRILGCWLPIFAFFAMGFEHSVVNLFVIPLGMALGAKIGFYDWWYWNEIPALVGNLVGGFTTGFALYTTYKPDQPDRHSATITRHPAMTFGEKPLTGRLP